MLFPIFYIILLASAAYSLETNLDTPKSILKKRSPMQQPLDAECAPSDYKKRELLASFFADDPSAHALATLCTKHGINTDENCPYHHPFTIKEKICDLFINEFRSAVEQGHYNALQVFAGEAMPYLSSNDYSKIFDIASAKGLPYLCSVVRTIGLNTSEIQSLDEDQIDAPVILACDAWEERWEAVLDLETPSYEKLALILGGLPYKVKTPEKVELLRELAESKGGWHIEHILFAADVLNLNPETRLPICQFGDCALTLSNLKEMQELTY